MEEKLNRLRELQEKQFEAILSEMNARFEAINARFEALQKEMNTALRPWKSVLIICNGLLELVLLL